jgi:hypothetical protein
MSMKIFEKEYDGHSIVDMSRDIYEAFDDRFNPEISEVPIDKHGFQTGTFTVTITWSA